MKSLGEARTKHSTILKIIFVCHRSVIDWYLGLKLSRSTGAGYLRVYYKDRMVSPAADDTEKFELEARTYGYETQGKTVSSVSPVTGWVLVRV